jgi:nucleoside-diphosphate-sugar epimerase
MKGKALPITGDGNETRDWTFVDDIVNGLLAMGIKDEAIGEAINLGSGKETKVGDMANMVNNLTNNKAGIEYVKRRNWDAKHRLLSSIGKAEKLIGYKPQTEFKDGVNKLYQWFCSNWDNIEKSAEF